jgi:hypothetical protein
LRRRTDVTDEQKRQLAEVTNHLIDAGDKLMEVDKASMSDPEVTYTHQVEVLVEVARGLMAKMDLVVRS